MGDKPTLLIKGKIIAAGATDQDVPLEFIQGWLRSRLVGTMKATLDNRVLIVRAETASGKSTALPVGVFRILRPIQSKKKYVGPDVICTQPRIANTITLAADITAGRGTSKRNPDMIMGDTVGFQTGPLRSKKVIGITYATIGVLAAQLQMLTDIELCDKYKFILVDEAHERSIESDTTLMLLRNFYIRNIGNPKLPFLMLLSATFDPSKYATYFGLDENNIMIVTGRAFPIHKFWLGTSANNFIGSDTSSNYPVDAARIAIGIHEANQNDIPTQADMLIFMPGVPECKAVAEVLADRLGTYEGTSTKPFLVLVLTGDAIKTQSQDFETAFRELSNLPKVNGVPPMRRIIISTAVAETGLTIYTLKYVIDPGWSRIKEVYYPQGVEGVITKPAPQSREQQRMGRSGRKFDGNYYPLYTEAIYNSLEENQLPAMILEGITDSYLSIVREQLKQKTLMSQPAEFRLEDISLLDQPSLESIQYANSLATGLGFIEGCHLTQLGEIAAKFSRTPMYQIRMILASFARGIACSDIITACAVCGVESIRKLYLNPKQTDHLMSVIYSGDIKKELKDDFIEMILIIDMFLTELDRLSYTELASFCVEHNLNIETLTTITSIRTQLIEETFIAGLNPFNNYDQRLSEINHRPDYFMDIVRRIKRCIYDGLKHNTVHEGLSVQRVPVGLNSSTKKARKYPIKTYVTDKLVMSAIWSREGDSPILYEVEANLISVLDGFVSPDLEFNECPMVNDSFVGGSGCIATYEMALDALNGVLIESV